MTRRAAIAALAFAALSQARGEWVTDVVTNRVEYDGVEYLRGDGYTYINTGVYIDITDMVSVTAAITENKTQCLVGGRVSSTVNSFGLWGYVVSVNGIRYDIVTAQNPTFPYSAQPIGSIFTMGKIGTDNYLNGIVIGNNGTVSSYTPQFFAYVFAMNNSGTAASISTAKIYSLSVADKINLIPVLHNGAGKMLNLVDGQLYANAGSGSFAYGAVTGKVAYVSVTTNRVYRAPAPMRSYDAQHPFNAPTARTRLGGTGSGEDGTTLRPTAHFDIKRNEED